MPRVLADKLKEHLQGGFIIPLLPQYGIIVDHTRYQIEATTATEAQEQVLDVVSGYPLLVVRYFPSAADGRPILAGQNVTRADRFTYTLRAVPNRGHLRAFVRLASEGVEEEGYPYARQWCPDRRRRAGPRCPLKRRAAPNAVPARLSAHCREGRYSRGLWRSRWLANACRQRMLRTSPSKTWSPYGLGERADGNAESSARMPDKASPDKCTATSQQIVLHGGGENRLRLDVQLSLKAFYFMTNCLGNVVKSSRPVSVTMND
ncbi:UTRA domain-containing protein [Bradyrhizobium canariense]|uniref:UTRA domain-containing protein n=1 Tax=Bradyrhizobium canariense TaxID=255045 RepID=UPI000A19A3D3|nr:hypothetical protein BST65_02520 [Bradyrhizobium canariense]OSI36901.1 hypothetical protein BST66_05145 [Bradyrhizobium canariense]OSI50929.1 hypothetical protein BSZ20_05225 [Bradyrhizobium canariense]OSI56933.1 hypothetical protein BST67_02695 [Bradyrhizobium canariense]OSI59647.1 hypothetical protein BSZ15_03730 [Bradyrhizobium canariense]